MSDASKAALFIILVPAFAIYIISECYLRRVSVAKIDSDKVKVDSVVSELPGAIRDSVKYNITVGQLTDRLNAAQTDKEKAFAMCNLAGVLADQTEKDRFFSEVLKKYPGLLEAEPAYTYFFMNPKTEIHISIPEYHKYINSQPEMERLSIWTNGYRRLARQRIKPEQQLEFLMPLMNEDAAPYREYRNFYKWLSKLAFKLKKNDIEREARELESKVLKKPSLNKIRREMERKAEKEKGKKGKK